MWRSSHILLPVILILGFILRWVGPDVPFWDDERISVACAVGLDYRNLPVSAGDVFTSKLFDDKMHPAAVKAATIRDGGNAVAYNLSLHYWIRAFGTSDRALRSFSVLCGILCVLFVYLLSFRLSEKALVAAFSAILIAIHPLLIRYSQAVRGYELATLGVLLATFLLVEAIHRPAKARGYLLWMGYAIAVGMSLLSHYLTIYLFIGHAVYVFLLKRGKKSFPGFLISGFAAAAGVSAWMFSGGWEGYQLMQELDIVYRQILNEPDQAGMWVQKSNLENLTAGLMESLNWICGNFLGIHGIRLRFASILSFLPLSVMLYGFIQKRRSASQNQLFMLLMGLLSFPFFFFLAIRSGHTASLAGLYFIFSVPYLFIWLAGESFEAGGNSNFLTPLMTSLLVLVMLFSLKAVYHKEGIWPENYPAKAATLAETLYEPGDTLVHGNPTQAFLLNLYLGGRADIIQQISPFDTHVIQLKRPGQNKAFKIAKIDVSEMSFGDIFEHLDL